MVQFHLCQAHFYVILFLVFFFAVFFCSFFFLVLPGNNDRICMANKGIWFFLFFDFLFSLVFPQSDNKNNFFSFFRDKYFFPPDSSFPCKQHFNELVSLSLLGLFFFLVNHCFSLAQYIY